MREAYAGNTAYLLCVVAFGVVLDRLVVRSLLVPAYAHDMAAASGGPTGSARSCRRQTSDRP